MMRLTLKDELAFARVTVSYRGAQADIDDVLVDSVLHNHLTNGLRDYMTNLPKRLIEVDLPIKRISAPARRKKTIRGGHIHALHASCGELP